MTKTQTSCIIPVFNGERYLREAIDSVLKQTQEVFEIVVIDDGSTDATPDIAASYGRRVRYHHQSNKGIAAARNRGLQVATGQLVAFLDADDIWHPEKLERQLRQFMLPDRLDISVTLVQNFWIPELQSEAERFRGHRFSQPLAGYVPQTLLSPRSLFTTIGEFDEAWGGACDLEWFIRAKRAGAIIELLPNVLVYRRLHDANISRTALAQNAILRVLKLSLDQQRQDGNERVDRISWHPQKPPTIT